MRDWRSDIRGFRSRSIGIFLLVVSLLIVHCSFAFAARPLYTEDTLIAPMNHVVIESGCLLLTARDNSGLQEVITTARYGISTKAEISIALPYVTRQDQGGNYDGLSNGIFNLKYDFLSAGDGKISAGYLFGIQLKSSDTGNGLNADKNDITNMFIYSQDIGFCTCLFNFGYTFDDERAGQPQNDFIIYDIAMTKPVNKAVNFTGEVQYSKNTYTGDIFSETAVGFNYVVTDKLTLDTALGCGLTENSSSSNFVFGLTYLLI
jgi:hypothetical protein